MRSMPPRDYESLPGLDAPEAYICVVRDIDSDMYRLEACGNPGAFIASLLDEEQRKFGIELVSILETEDLAASESELYHRYQAMLGREWLELDPYQIEELRGSILQIDAHASHYLTPRRSRYAKQEPPAEQISRDDLIAYRRYGTRSLRSNRDASGQSVEQREADLSFRDHVARAFDDALVNHPGAVIFVILLILIIGLAILEPTTRF